MVRRGRCTACYERTRGARERKTVGTCGACGRARLAYHRRGLCPACYEQRRYREFRCGSCGRVVTAPASYAALATCPRCYSRARTVAFTCPDCGRACRGRPQGGLCRRCAHARTIRVATCRICGQTRKAPHTRDEICDPCLRERARRLAGIPAKRAAEAPEQAVTRLLGRLAPLRRAWVRDFLRASQASWAPTTAVERLRVLARFDAYLAADTTVGAGQWALVTPAHVEAYLLRPGGRRLRELTVVFAWLRHRHGCADLASVLPRRGRSRPVATLPLADMVARYRRWTAGDCPVVEAFVGLAVLLHCLTAGELRHLRVADVLAPDTLLVGGRVVELAPPVAAALARYRAWRAEHYGGPSPYLLVNAVSRRRDRPVGETWFSQHLLGCTVAALRQSAIQRLVQDLGCDGLQLAAYTDRSLAAVQEYLRRFGTPRPPFEPET